MAGVSLQGLVGPGLILLVGRERPPGIPSDIGLTELELGCHAAILHRVSMPRPLTEPGAACARLIASSPPHLRDLRREQQARGFRWAVCPHSA
jgi:hypothetical protein